jgi:hypothetical protein
MLKSVNSNIDVNQITGTLPVSKGGTGATSITSGYVVKGSGTSPFAATSLYSDANGNLGLGTTGPGGNTTNRVIAVSGSDSGAVQAIGGTVSTQLSSSVVGFGAVNVVSNHALLFFTNNTERARMDTAGNIALGTQALATNATNGFVYIPTCAGAPTGTPTTFTGLAPMVVDSANNKLYVYISGAWRVMN